MPAINEERLAADEIVLYFAVEPNQFADTKVVAEALLRWVELLQETVSVIDPGSSVQLEIIGNERGSLKIPQLIKFLNSSIGDIDAAWSEYPYIKKAVLGSAHVLCTGVVTGLISMGMYPSVQKVELSQASIDKLAAAQEKVGDSPNVQRASRRFYQTVDRDPAITGVGVAQSRDEEPFIVPKSEFGVRGGLWSIEEDPEPTHEITDEWDVVLLKAPFSGKRLAWQFSRDGLPFNALMDDAIFLSAVKDGRVPINLQEGVTMRIQVAYTEHLEGQVWKTDPRSRRVTKVLSPAPLAAKPGTQKP